MHIFLYSVHVVHPVPWWSEYDQTFIIKFGISSIKKSSYLNFKFVGPSILFDGIVVTQLFTFRDLHLSISFIIKSRLSNLGWGCRREFFDFQYFCSNPSWLEIFFFRERWRVIFLERNVFICFTIFTVFLFTKLINSLNKNSFHLPFIPHVSFFSYWLCILFF